MSNADAQATVQVQRGFVEVDGRAVHYRCAGRGPAVLLIHQSPQTSASMLPLLEPLAARCTVFAPDTPGFGWSDSIADQPTIGDYARNLIGFCDALGIGRAAIAGVHTGALVACEFALQAPERVELLVLDGYGLFTETEREEVLADYFPPNPLRWDGAHLLWAWTRVREQYLFFPWYDQRAGHRLAYDVPSPEYLHGALMDILPRGDDYAPAYRASFLYRRGEQLPGLRCRTVFLYRRNDVLIDHVDRLPELPAACRVEIVEDKPTADQRAVELLAAAAGDESVQLPDCRLGDRQLIDGLFVRCFGAKDAEPLLLLHDIGRSNESLMTLAGVIGEHYRVIVPDLPGHGRSDHGDRLDDAIARLANRARQQCASPLCIVAIGHSTALLPAVAEPDDRLFGLSPPVAEDHEVLLSNIATQGIAFTAEHSGAHLLRWWQRIRDGRLFQPGHRLQAAYSTGDTPDLTPASVHAEVIEALLCGHSWADHWRWAGQAWQDASSWLPDVVLVTAETERQTALYNNLCAVYRTDESAQLTGQLIERLRQH